MLKYKTGDFVLYGFSGACEVAEIGPLSFGGPDRKYYSLKPVYDCRDTIYVPVDKEDDIPRKVIGKKEAEEIIASIQENKCSGKVPEKEKCDAILKSGDNFKISNMIKQLRNLRTENRKNHKGLNIADEKLLKYAERILFSEIAIAMKMSMEEVADKLDKSLDE